MGLVLNKKEIAKIRHLCTIAEEKGWLTPPVLKIIYRNKWFKLFVPKKLGGLGLSLPEALQYEEKLAYIDGSLGWTITLCAGANLFVGYIPQHTATSIFSKNNVCFGGSGAATGVAQLVEGGYIINGSWKYATGAPHLTHYTANCIIHKDAKIVVDKNGVPITRSFFFKKSEVTVKEDWNTMGLKATAGHSFIVKDLKVASDRSFVIDTASTTLNKPIYQYPFMPLAEATIAVNTLGMTKHFLEEAKSIVQQRQRENKISKVQYKELKSEIQVGTKSIKLCSSNLYDAIRQSWKEVVTNKSISQNHIDDIAIISRDLVKMCRRLVSDIFPYCGLAAANEASVINKIFRDIFTASQHSLLNFSKRSS